MKNITLKSMTRELCHELFRHFEADPAVFRKDQAFRQYRYSQSGCDSYYDRQIALGRIYLAIMLNDRIIGEIILKNIDREQSSCRLSIHLVSDSVKNRGYGTAAEILALEYAFTVEGMNCVYADALRENKRSIRVLEKAGFKKTGQDEIYSYYVCAAPNDGKGPEPSGNPS